MSTAVTNLYVAQSTSDGLAKQHGLFKIGQTTRGDVRINELAGSGSTHSFKKMFTLPLPTGITDQAVLKHPLLKPVVLRSSAKNHDLQNTFCRLWGRKHRSGLSKRRELVLTGKNFPISRLKRLCRIAIKELVDRRTRPNKYQHPIHLDQIQVDSWWILRPSTRNQPFWIGRVKHVNGRNVTVQYWNPSDDTDVYHTTYTPHREPGTTLSFNFACLPDGRGLQHPLHMRRVRKHCYQITRRYLPMVRHLMMQFALPDEK
jgi:hypothetical protein